MQDCPSEEGGGVPSMDSIGTPPMDPTRPDKLLFLPLDNWRKVKKKRVQKIIERNGHSLLKGEKGYFKSKKDKEEVKSRERGRCKAVRMGREETRRLIHDVHGR